MEKIVFIGDIHGSPAWKKHINTCDRVVFVGDYVDSFNYIPIEILRNLEEIVQFKLDNYEKVNLLLGNHDIQYIYGYDNFGCSGFKQSMLFDYSRLFRTNSSYINGNTPLFEVAYQKENTLVTHAGLHRGFWEKAKKVASQLEIDLTQNYAQVLNDLYILGEVELLGQCSFRRGGSYKEPGIFWADKLEIYKKPIHDLVQIMGHTSTNEIKHYVNKRSELYFIDCLWREVLTLEI